MFYTLSWLVIVLLAARRFFIHQSTLSNSEDNHVLKNPPYVVAEDLLPLAAADVPVAEDEAEAPAVIVTRCRLGTELEVNTGKFIKCSFVPEEYNLAKGQSSQLETNSKLGRVGVSKLLSAYKSTAFTVRTTNTYATLTDTWKNRIAVTITEQRSTLSRIFEQVDCSLLIFVIVFIYLISCYFLMLSNI